MAEELVTIRIFSDPIEAGVMKSKLDAEGIYCFIVNEALMSSPHLRTVIGQVELRVRSSDVEKVKEILGLP